VEVLGLSVLQIAVVAILLLILVVLLLVARFVLRATRRFFRAGCLGITILALAAWLAIRILGA